MAEDWAALITVDRVLDLYQQGMLRYGDEVGEVPVAASDCVASAVGNAWSAALYRERPEAIRGLCFASYLLVYLAKDHCFVDGNKRVAWLSAMEILAQRRLSIMADDDEAEDLVLQIIQGEMQPEDVIRWISGRLTWID